MWAPAGDLRENQFPYVPEFAPATSSKWRPKEIIVFIVGGAAECPLL